MHIHHLLLLPVLGLLLSGCGESRRDGDADGIPVTFTVHTERAFFSRMSDHRTSVSSGVGVGFGGGGGGIGTGVGLGIGFHGTTAYLLGGDNPNEYGSFRKELSWGDTTFTVPLRVGRVLTLTAQAEGGREGWETIGKVTVAAGTTQNINLVLNADGSKLTMK